MKITLINNKFFEYSLLSLTLLYPIFFIIGNFAINLSLICMIFLSILFFNPRSNLIKLDKKLVILILIFFLYLIISSFNSYYIKFSLLKSLGYFRFFLFVIFFVLILNKFNSKIQLFGKILIFSSLFVIIDSYIQLFFGKDLFGFPDDKAYGRLSGPFGDELIVGNYVLFFGILGICLLSYNNKIKKINLIFFFFLIGIFCFMSGERNSFLSFLIFIFFLFFLSKEKISIILSLLLVFIFSTILFFTTDRYNQKYSIGNIQSGSDNQNISSEITNINKTRNKITNVVVNRISNSIWLGHYRAGIKIFNDNKILGSGFKSFRFICYDRFIKEHEEGKKIICSSHPHNYYIELISDLGIIGIILFLLLVFYQLSLSIKKILNDYQLSNAIIISLFITAIFPFRPHGSLFSTSSAFLVWLLFATLIFFSLKKKT